MPTMCNASMIQRCCMLHACAGSRWLGPPCSFLTISDTLGDSDPLRVRRENKKAGDPHGARRRCTAAACLRRQMVLRQTQRRPRRW
jgi:hypothetical protein